MKILQPKNHDSSIEQSCDFLKTRSRRPWLVFSYNRGFYVDLCWKNDDSVLKTDDSVLKHDDFRRQPGTLGSVGNYGATSSRFLMMLKEREMLKERDAKTTVSR